MTQPLDAELNLLGQTIFTDYTITRALGQGAMGAVFLAEHQVIGQKIAIKVVKDATDDNHELIQRFNREAKVISLLSHPNIIRVFIFGRTDEGLSYLTMEYVDGESLESLALSGDMEDELVVIKVIKQICSALAEAHDLGIVHRDLKPANILITKFRGERHYVKILDFGIAKMTEETNESPLTQAGMVFGTPDYIAPEQAMAKPLDGRCDLYSLGVILFQLITGKLPYVRDTVINVLKAHAFEEVPEPQEFSDKPIAPTMVAIIKKAMAKDPDQRFQTAMAFYNALEEREFEIYAKSADSAATGAFPGEEAIGLFETTKALNQPLVARRKRRTSVSSLGNDTQLQEVMSRIEKGHQLDRFTHDKTNKTSSIPPIWIAGLGALLFIAIALLITLIIVISNAS